MRCKEKEPEIVKVLRVEEKKGFPLNKVNSNSKSNNDKEDESYKLLNEEINKKLQELAGHYQFLAENTVDIIWETTSTATITYMSSATKRLLGYEPEEMIGKKVWKFVPKTYLPKYFPILRKCVKGGIIDRFETVLRHKDGHIVNVEYSGKFVKKGNKKRIIGTIKDITERKIAEEKLERMNKELKKAQEELSILNKDLEKKVEERTEEIQKLLKHKIEFIGHLGHDLKTPLTPMVGLLPTIEEREKDPELKELLGIINRNVLFMRDIVVKTLKLERLNSPVLKLNFEQMNLFDCIDMMVGSKEQAFKEKKLFVANNVAKDILVPIDKIEFNELMDNLLTNAVNFTPCGGGISVDANVENDFVRVSVCDAGLGLTDDQMEHVFEEFYKCDPSRQELDGSGLGLSICKRIVELHDGRILVESAGLGKGSTFHFLLPTKLRNET